MPCYKPMQAQFKVLPDGKKEIKFSNGYAKMFHTGQDMEHLENSIAIPCGKCIGCRLDHSRTWAARITHEASLYEDNCFITLTYNDENLPKDGSLDKEHFQKFMKRLRFKYSDRTIRFYHCGEYGDLTRRPHYHACLFNIDFPDKKLISNKGGNRLYSSSDLEQLWPFGHSSIGALTFDSAAYVARYCTKKVSGPKAAQHYGHLQPEYATMSTNPGLGKGWFDKYKSDVYPHDYVVIKGKTMRVPRYYDKQLEKQDPELLKKIKESRLDVSDTVQKNGTADRLRVREICHKQRTNFTREVNATD